MNLERTKKAIEAYDAYNPPEDAWTLKEERALGRAVGHAFGLDTAGLNALSTCEACVRPGPAVAGVGQELSYVRLLVARWEKAPVRAVERIEFGEFRNVLVLSCGHTEVTTEAPRETRCMECVTPERKAGRGT